MALETTKAGWTVIDEEAAVLSMSYEFTKDGTSNCFVARLPSGGLMIVSPPVRISGAALDELGRYGRVEAIVANNGLHYLGVPSWRARFPTARCFAAPGAAARIAKKSDEVGTLEPLTALAELLGDDVAVLEAPASKCGETWARAKIAEGWAWYASDLLANMPKLPSKFPVRQLFKWTKSAPGYRVFNLATKFILKDKAAALAAMLADVEAHPPTVMVPGHGEILAGDSLADDTKQLLQSGS